MKRCASLLLLFLSASPAAAQDTPLSMILIDGQDWRLVTKDNAGEWEFAQSLRKGGSVMVTAGNGTQYSINDEKKVIVGQHLEATTGKPREFPVPGLNRPAGITLWPDGRRLVVGDADGKHLWAFRVEKEGDLTAGDRYYALRVKRGQTKSGVSALTVDDKGRLYAGTPLGVQVFDPTGRLCGVLLKPSAADPTAIAFGGPERDLLFVAHGAEVYVRKTQSKGLAPVENKP
jgi:sugar lactone lactonase YvrE